MADLARIKRNVAKMASMGAPEADIDGYIASEGVTVDDVKNFGRPQLSPMTDEQRAQAAEMAREIRPKRENVALAGLTGFGEGAKLFGENVLNGLTAGLYGAANRELGGDFKERNEQAGANKYANIAGDILGSVAGAGTAAYNLAGRAGLKGVARLAGAGALESGVRGASEGDTVGQAAYNVLPSALVGGVSGGALGLAGKAIKRLVPSLNVIGKKSINDAFTDRETTIALKRGAKASQKISDELAQEMPIIKDNINSKMNNVVDNTIGETPDIDGMLQNAKRGYTDYMVMNAENPVNLDSLRNSYKKFTPFEKKSLKDALKSANFETNSPIGTVEHTHQMRMAVDDAIDSAMKKSNNRHVPSLNKIRKSLDDILKTDSGYKSIDDKYAEAMKLQEAYNSGYSATKTSKKPTFSNDLERKAWVSGVNEKLKNNLVNTDSNYAKSISDNLSILKNGLGNSEFKGLKKAASEINKEYSRASGLDKIVNKESAAENLPFWREVLESIGSAVGATVGSAEKALYKISDTATANRILSGKSIPTYSNILNASRASVPSISALLAQEVVKNQ